MAQQIPRSIAIQAILYCDQLEAELSQGNTELVRNKLESKFQGWLDNFSEADAVVALQAIRALANESLNERGEE